MCIKTSPLQKKITVLVHQWCKSLYYFFFKPTGLLPIFSNLESLVKLPTLKISSPLSLRVSLPFVLSPSFYSCSRVPSRTVPRKLLFPSHYLICASPLGCKSSRYSALFSINSIAVKLQLPITKHYRGRKRGIETKTRRDRHAGQQKMCLRNSRDDIFCSLHTLQETLCPRHYRSTNFRQQISTSQSKGILKVMAYMWAE